MCILMPYHFRRNCYWMYQIYISTKLSWQQPLYAYGILYLIWSTLYFWNFLINLTTVYFTNKFYPKHEIRIRVMIWQALIRYRLLRTNFSAFKFYIVKNQNSNVSNICSYPDEKYSAKINQYLCNMLFSCVSRKQYINRFGYEHIKFPFKTSYNVLRVLNHGNPYFLEKKVSLIEILGIALISYHVLIFTKNEDKGIACFYIHFFFGSSKLLFLQIQQ